jgi:hypothetical protein
LLEFLALSAQKALKFTHYSLYRSLATSRPLKLVLLISSYLLSCILVVVKVDAHDPSAVVTLLTKHVKDCSNMRFNVKHVNI